MRACHPYPSIYGSQPFGRRSFLAAAGASAMMLNSGVFNLVSPSSASDKLRTAKLRLGNVFVHPGPEAYWMGWPGACYDRETRQAAYVQMLAQAAQQLDVQLELDPTAIHTPEEVEQLIARLQKDPPGGLIVTLMHLKDWPQVRCIAENRGDIPLVVYSPLGTSLTHSDEGIRDLPHTFVAATPDPAGLAFAVRMLHSLWEMQHARICMVTDLREGDQLLSPLGAVLHYVPLQRWIDDVASVKVDDEVKGIAREYAVRSKEIVEPEMDDLLNAARNYVAACRMMEAENCQLISVDCAPLVGERKCACGPCLAWSRLLDEGRIGACEADWRAALSLYLVRLLFDKPGFMQDTAPDTINNTLIGSHCTCATKLDGFDNPAAPFELRNHAESQTGVSLQVQWRGSQEITIVRFQSPGSLLLGTGHVLRNVETSHGGCRTAVEFAIDGVDDPRDLQGHHQVLAYGKLDGPIRAFCQLAGIEVAAI